MTTRLVRYGDDLYQVVALVYADGSIEPIEVIFVPTMGVARLVQWDELPPEIRQLLRNAFQ